MKNKNRILYEIYFVQKTTATTTATMTLISAISKILTITQFTGSNVPDEECYPNMFSPLFSRLCLIQRGVGGEICVMVYNESTNTTEIHPLRNNQLEELMKWKDNREYDSEWLVIRNNEPVGFTKSGKLVNSTHENDMNKLVLRQDM